MSIEKMIEENKGDRIEFKVKSKKPKPNAITYKIETIEDIFTHVNIKNKNRFLKDLGAMIEFIELNNNLFSAIAESKGEKFNRLIPKEMDWTDD